MEEGNRQLLSRVWRPLNRAFTSKIERACLRRDAYLDHVFAHEAGVLKDEIPGPNSPEARTWLQGKLEELDRLAVNFSLSPATIEAVNRACDELNVIRDCFINRVLFLLIADVDICETVIRVNFHEYLGDILGDHERDYLYAPLWGGGLHAVSEIVGADPFRALRNIIDHFRRKDESLAPLHACVIWPEMFPKNPLGVSALNCYLPDESVPGTAAAARGQELLAELLGFGTDSQQSKAAVRPREEVSTASNNKPRVKRKKRI